MRNSKRNGFIKSLTSVLAVVLMLALMLTGCTDKEAQSLANTAQGVADKAQESADDANSLAQSAQNKTEENKAAIEALETAVSQLATSEQVAKIISDKLADYVTNKALETELAKYVTLTYLEQELKDVDGAIATLKTELEAKIKANTDGLDEVVATVLESEEFKKAVDDALADYVTTTVFEEAIDGVNDKIAALEKLLVGENYASGTVEGLVGDIYDAIDQLGTDLDTLETTVNQTITNEIGTLKTTLGNEIKRVEGLISDLETKLQNALQKHVDDYDAATEYIIIRDAEFDMLLADYAAKKAQYTEKVYDLIVKNINDNRVRFRRALKADCTDDEGGAHDDDNLCCAAAILDSVKENAASQKNLAQVLADALDAVYYVEINGTKYVVIEDLNGIDANSSRTGLEVAEEVLALIVKNEVEAVASAYLDPNTNQYRDLVEETHELRSAVDNLDAIKEYAANNVITAINAITGSVKDGTDNYVDGAFAAVTVDLAKKYLGVDSDRDALEAKYDTAAVARDEYIETKFAGDDNNPNITRLVNNWERFNAANTRIGELQDLDAEVTAYVAEISELLTAKAYNVVAGEANYLYSDYETLKDLADEVAEWLETYVSTEDNYADVITNYDDDESATTEDLDIVAAVTYAKAMVDKFDEAHAEGGLVDDIDDVLDDDISIANYDKYYEVYNALQTWKTGVDQTNIEAIINYVEADEIAEGDGRLEQFEALKAKYDALKTALDNVEAINKRIAALVELVENGEMTIGTMSAEIRPLRNEIVNWLNTANIAIPTQETPDLLISWILDPNDDRNDTEYTVTGVDYVEANWKMLDSKEFLSVLEAYDDIVEVVIGYAQNNVLPLFEAIKNNSLFTLPEDGSYDHILYLRNDIDKAMTKYSAWVSLYKVDATDLKTYDLGETYKEVANLISEQLLELLDANQRCVDTLAEAKTEYEEFETLLGEALADSYTVGIMANKIPEAYEYADAWYDYYINAELGFNAVIKAYSDILTEEEYNAIVAKYNSYETLVAEAINDYNEFKAQLDKVTVGEYDVYDAPFFQKLTYSGVTITFVGYDVSDTLVISGDGNADGLLNAWAWKVLATMSKYGVSGAQTELLTTFKSANMDARFNTNVEGGINMVTLIEKIAKIYGGPDNEDSYEYFIDQLVAEANGIRDSFDAKFTETYLVTIYSRKDIKPIRDAYDAWAIKAGMTNDTAAYAAPGLDAEIAGYIELLNDIEDMEEAITNIENQKNTETSTVISLIEGLASIGGSDKVTTLNREQIMTAWNAYQAWHSGDYNKDSVLDEADAYKIDDTVTDMYVISAELKDTLDAYKAALDALDEKIDAIKDLVDAIPEEITDPEAYQNAINEANKALDEYFEANGGNTDGIDAKVAGAIAEAEIALAIYNTLATKVEVDPDNADEVAAYEALEKELNDAAVLMIATFYAESEDPDAPLNQYEDANNGEAFSTLSANFSKIINDILAKDAYAGILVTE